MAGSWITGRAGSPSLSPFELRTHGQAGDVERAPKALRHIALPLGIVRYVGKFVRQLLNRVEAAPSASCNPLDSTADERWLRSNPRLAYVMFPPRISSSSRSVVSKYTPLGWINPFAPKSSGPGEVDLLATGTHARSCRRVGRRARS